MAAARIDQPEGVFEQMTKLTDDDIALIGEYALGLLDENEVAQVEARMNRDPDLRDAYAAWCGDLVRLTDGITDVPPPASLKPAVISGVMPAVGTRRWFGWGMGLAAAVAVVMVFAIPQFSDTAPDLTATLQSETTPLNLLVAYDEDTTNLEITTLVGYSSAGRSLELWAIVGDNAPVSLGVLSTDTSTTVALPQSLQAVAGSIILAVSDEPFGGSVTGAPTGDVLAAGPLTKL
jgi:anti-sigma-K factor RskA